MQRLWTGRVRTIATMGLAVGLACGAMPAAVHAQSAPGASGPAQAPVAAPVATSPKDALRQVAGILDYIAGDYREAVDERGEVLNRGEYDEQLALSADAAQLATLAGLAKTAAAQAALAELHALLERRAAPAQVAQACRAVVDLLVARHGLVLGPAAPPERVLGERVYREQGCASCHGEDGAARTEAAAQLDPRPAAFTDAERMATVSPHRAFYAISYGVAGTSMAGFRHLDEHARWSLAFFVLSMRHSQAQALAGQQALARLDALDTRVPREAGLLAGLTDEDLATQLAALVPDEQRAHALSYLRRDAPFRSASPVAAPRGAERFARLRAELSAGASAHARGDVATARMHLVAAYLEGFEPHEAALSARDAALVREIERAMLELRQRASDPSASDIDARVARLLALLQAAQQPSDGSAAFWGAFAITLREGLEAVLLAGALLLLVRKRGAPELARFVHAGWIAALLLGAVTFALAGHLLSGMQRELAEGIAALLAAVVLLGVTHWLLGQLSAQRFMGFLAERLGRVVRGRRAALGVFGLSFIAVYREAFEVVLFFQALLLEAGPASERVWLGAGAGLSSLVVVALVLRGLGQRLSPRPLMLASSGLLAVLAFSLAGKGVRALQEAGVSSIHAVPFFELPSLGVYATVEGLVVQGLLLAALLASALLPWLAARRVTAAPAG